MRREALNGPVLALAPLVFLLALVVAPLGALFWQATAGDAGDTLPTRWWADDYLQWRVVWTLIQALATCVLALLIGLPMAWVLARLSFPGRELALRLLMLPFVMPTLVAAMGVLALLGPRGWIGEPLAARGWDLSETPWLLLYGNLFFNLCLVVRAGVEALEQVSAQQVAAARTLGASAWRAFWRVEWPTLLPWLASALCLVFLYCFSGLGLALVLGGHRYATVEVEIYTLVAHELELKQAGLLALGMLVITGLTAMAYAWIERSLVAPAGVWPMARVRPGSLVQWLAVLSSMGLLLMVCGAPLVVIAWRAMLAVTAGQGWQALQAPTTWLALANTLRFTAAAVVVATVLGVLHALAGKWLDDRAMARGVAAGAGGAVWWRAASYLPFVVSSVTVAFGLLILYPALTASLVLLLAAYVLLAYPFVARSMTAALDQLPAQYLQAARTLGASPWRVWWRVTLPLVMPSLRRGMAFAAATALGEFAVTLFLSRPEWTTLTTLIYQHLGRPGSGNLDAALVLAFVLMVLALGTFWWLEGSARGRLVAQGALAGAGAMERQGHA